MLGASGHKEAGLSLALQQQDSDGGGAQPVIGERMDFSLGERLFESGEERLMKRYGHEFCISSALVGSGT